VRSQALIGAAWAVFVSVLGVAKPARAADVSDTDRQIAQSLFDEGRTLLETGKVSEACPKFAESQRLDPGGGTLLNLALCLELAGRTASAWARYQEAVALAVRDSRKDREEFARVHLRTLGPKLTRVVVIVPPALAAQDPIVQLDGSRLAREAWGTAIAVDPGTHLVESQTTTTPRWESKLDASDEGRAYRIEVGSAASLPEEKVEPPKQTRTRSTAFWIVLGGSAAALATSAVFGITALDAKSEADDGCIESRSFCTPAARDAGSRARTQAWLSTGFMAAGLVGVGVAFLLPLETKTTVAIAPAEGGGRASVATRF
jgi:hypothetical protein